MEGDEMIAWKEPETLEEWDAQLEAVREQSNSIQPPVIELKIDNDPWLELDKVAQLKSEYSRAFDDLTEPRERMKILVNIIREWHKGKESEAILEAGLNREKYPSDGMRKAYRDQQARPYFKRLLSANTLNDCIGSKRSKILKDIDLLKTHSQDVKKVHYAPS